jgi:hypothetical protein
MNQIKSDFLLTKQKIYGLKKLYRIVIKSGLAGQHKNLLI